jgi:hypothetical protein
MALIFDNRNTVSELIPRKLQDCLHPFVPLNVELS